MLLVLRSTVTALSSALYSCGQETEQANKELSSSVESTCVVDASLRAMAPARKVASLLFSPQAGCR